MQVCPVYVAPVTEFCDLTCRFCTHKKYLCPSSVLNYIIYVKRQGHYFLASLISLGIFVSGSTLNWVSPSRNPLANLIVWILADAGWRQWSSCFSFDLHFWWRDSKMARASQKTWTLVHCSNCVEHVIAAMLFASMLKSFLCSYQLEGRLDHTRCTLVMNFFKQFLWSYFLYLYYWLFFFFFVYIYFVYCSAMYIAQAWD